MTQPARLSESPGSREPPAAESGAATSLTPSGERWLLWTLAGVQFTHIVDFMVMMPLGPQLTRIFGISDAQFGLLVSAYTPAAGASGLLAALGLDRFERKRLLLVLYLGFALATLACGLAPSYALLMAARIAAGLFGGVLSALAQTMIGDTIPYERRGHAMGIVMSAFSLSTVAGVPASLWLAQSFGWHAPFLAIGALSFGVAAAAARTLPRLAGHLAGEEPRSLRGDLGQLLREPRHWHAFAFTALMMFGGFTVIPYITIYVTANVGLPEHQVPTLYLAGGLATLCTARLWGRLADRWGKVRTFRLIALLSLLPLLAITHLPQGPLWMTLAVSSAFFTFVPGRMVPGMALITAAATPRLRGNFMSLNAAVQSASMGLAALLGGALIGRSADGLVQGYGSSGWVAAAATVLALFAVGRLQRSNDR